MKKSLVLLLVVLLSSLGCSKDSAQTPHKQAQVAFEEGGVTDPKNVNEAADAEKTPKKDSPKTETTTVESLQGKWTAIYGEWSVDQSGVYHVKADEGRNKHKIYVNDVEVQSFRTSVAIRKPNTDSWAGFGFCFTNAANTYVLAIQGGSVRLKKRVSGKEEQLAEGPKLPQETATNWIFFTIEFRPGRVVVAYSSDGTTFAPLFDLKDESHSKGSLALMCCENEFTASYKVESFLGTKEQPATKTKLDKTEAAEKPKETRPSTADSGTPQVIAEGIGATADESLKDAFRNAVRQVVGAVVDAETLVKNDKIISDKVLTYSDGFVKTYEEISKKQDQGLFRTKIKATVERRSVIAKLKAANIAVKDVDGKGIFAEIVTQLEAEENAKELMEKTLEGFPLNVLEAEIGEKPEVVERNASSVKVRITVRFTVNVKAFDAFAEKLQRTLRTIAKEKHEFSLLKMKPPNRDGQAFFGQHVGKEDPVIVALNTHRTKMLDRTEWACYILDRNCLGPLANRHHLLTATVSLLGNDEHLIAVDRFPAKGDNNVPQVLPIRWQHGATNYEGDYLFQFIVGGNRWLRQKVFWLCPFFLWEPGDTGNTRLYCEKVTVHRTITLTLDELKSIRSIKCQLSQ